ncbi:hypothetical protein D3C80_1825400 [compost metagenome]
MDSLNTSWATTNWESVAAAEPEFIILVDYQAETTDDTDQRHLFLEQHPLMKHTRAVLHHRYLKLKYQELTPGPVNIDAIRKLAHALYPAAFT